jgi:hypothetical protein
MELYIYIYNATNGCDTNDITAFQTAKAKP